MTSSAVEAVYIYNQYKYVTLMSISRVWPTHTSPVNQSSNMSTALARPMPGLSSLCTSRIRLLDPP